MNVLYRKFHYCYDSPDGEQVFYRHTTDGRTIWQRHIIGYVGVYGETNIDSQSSATPLAS